MRAWWIGLAAGGLLLVAVPVGVRLHRGATPVSGAANATGSTPTVTATMPDPSQQHDSPTARATLSTAATPHATAPAPNAAVAWFTVHLGSACARPGDTQTLSVQSRPGYVVAYNTRYSDGRQGNTYGGAGYSPVNSDGSYRSAWTVSPAAPLGTVTVNVGTQRGDGTPFTTRATFTVATHC